MTRVLHPPLLFSSFLLPSSSTTPRRLGPREGGGEEKCNKALLDAEQYCKVASPGCYMCRKKKEEEEEEERAASSHVCQHRNSTTNSWVERTDGWRRPTGGRRSTRVQYCVFFFFFFFHLFLSALFPFPVRRLLLRKSNQVIPTLKPRSFPSLLSLSFPPVSPVCQPGSLSFLLPLPEGFWTDGR